MPQTIEIRREEAVVTVALNRPRSHNAMTPQMIAELTGVFDAIGDDKGVRAVVLTGNGRSFCAGADLTFMRAAADMTFAENVADGEAIFDLMMAVDKCPLPVVARVNGATIGGGVGLISCCDIVVAIERAIFALSEVRLGILPAVISPFVLARTGTAAARQLFLTGERFTADHAHRIGLVDHVVTDEAALDEKVTERVDALLHGAPGAQAAAKELIRAMALRPKEEMRAYTTQLIARRRASDEGREGMSAFLEKRRPFWQEGMREGADE